MKQKETETYVQMEDTAVIRVNTARQKFALNIDECAHAILKRGSKRTVLVQGDIGSGKSSILMMLAKALPTHIPI